MSEARELWPLIPKFGMYEMELAAARIVIVCRRDNRPTFGVEDMVGAQERKGFVELLYRELLCKDGCTYNGEFTASHELAERLAAAAPLGVTYSFFRFTRPNFQAPD